MCGLLFYFLLKNSVSDVQQSDSVMCVCVYINVLFFRFFSIIVYYKILNIVVCIIL